MAGCGRGLDIRTQQVGPWYSEVDRFLVANEGKPSRERLTLIRIYEEVLSLGYEGSDDAIRRYAKTWSKARGSAEAEAYVPLYYAPGEAYQLDWCHKVVLIGGVTTTVKVARVRLCHSRLMFARAYSRQNFSMLASCPYTSASISAKVRITRWATTCQRKTDIKSLDRINRIRLRNKVSWPALGNSAEDYPQHSASLAKPAMNAQSTRRRKFSNSSKSGLAPTPKPLPGMTPSPCHPSVT